MARDSGQTPQQRVNHFPATKCNRAKTATNGIVMKMKTLIRMAMRMRMRMRMRIRTRVRTRMQIRNRAEDEDVRT